MEEKAIRIAYGEALARLGEKNSDIVVLDADLSKATTTYLFGEKFPNRFFNAGIAEQNMMGVAAGMAMAGKIPIASTFAIFGVGRAYEIVRNSISYGNFNVKLALTHAGISIGEDGGSHQSIEDIALMRVMPNMVILSPCDAIEVEKALNAMVEYTGPCYLRMGRMPSPIVTDENTPFEIGKANVMREGSDICIFTTGIMVAEALKVAKMLEGDNKSSTIINIHTIKPIDRQLILDMSKKHKTLVSVEEHSIIGGLGSAISEVLTDEYPKHLLRIGVNDMYGQSGESRSVLEHYGLTAETIYPKIKNGYSKN